MPGPRVNRKFGIEIEISDRHISSTEIREKLQPIVEAEGQIFSTQEAGNCWTLKSDGSCGYEVTTPAIQASENNFAKLYKIIHDFRRSIAGTHIIDRRCGLHVHFSISEFTSAQIKNLINTFKSYEDILISLQPPSRHQNYYAERIKSNGSLTRALNNPAFSTRSLPITNHYSGLNFNRYSQRKTIEVRYAAGSIRERKIVNWTQVLLYLIEHSKRVENVVYRDRTLEDLKILIMETATSSWLDQKKGDLCIWVQNRHDELNNNSQ